MDKNSVKEEVEQGIEKICEIFRKLPYYFYSENDIHCHFFNHLVQNTSLGSEINSESGVKTTLLHKEFPTWVRYRFDQKKKRYLNEKEAQGKRCVPAHYDIAILDEGEINKITDWDYFKTSSERPIKPFLAVEFGLYAYLDHIEKDFVKLSDKENGVEYGYIVHFLRDINLKDKRLNDLRKSIESIIKKNKVTVRCLIVFTKELRVGRKIVEKVEGNKNYLIEFKNGNWYYKPENLEDVLRKNSNF